MAEGRGSSRLYSLRLISLGLRLTASLPGELQNSRAGAGYPAPARPDHPRRAPTSAPPSGSWASRACALAPPTAAPPSSCPDSERPASLLGGHVDPGWGGGRGCASPLPGAVTPEESASRSPSACARASRSQSALAPQSHPAVGRGWTGCYPRPDQRSGSRTFSPVPPHQQHRAWHTVHSMNRPETPLVVGFFVASSDTQRLGAKKVGDPPDFPFLWLWRTSAQLQFSAPPRVAAEDEEGNLREHPRGLLPQAVSVVGSGAKSRKKRKLIQQNRLLGRSGQLVPL